MKLLFSFGMAVLVIVIVVAVIWLVSLADPSPEAFAIWSLIIFFLIALTAFFYTILKNK
jgi:hypothetical protein